MTRFGLMNRYLVTSFSIVPRGTEGAVSLEGTMAGLVASILLAEIACYVNLVIRDDLTLIVLQILRLSLYTLTLKRLLGSICMTTVYLHV